MHAKKDTTVATIQSHVAEWIEAIGRGFERVLQAPSRPKSPKSARFPAIAARVAPPGATANAHGCCRSGRAARIHFAYAS